MLLLFLSLAAILICWAYVKWSSVIGYWKYRGVPFIPPHPIWGSLTFLQKKNPGEWMIELYSKFKAPYVGIWLFWRPALVINNPEIAHRILVKDFDVFRNRLVGTGTAKTDAVGGLNIFTVDDPIWSAMRRRLTPVFTSAKLKGLHHLFHAKSKELVQRINNDLKDNKEIEMRFLFTDYTTDVIGIAAFGVGSDATLTSESPMRAVTKDFMRFSALRGFAWSSIFFCPELVKFFRFSFFPKKSEQYFRKVYKQIVTQRGGYNAEWKDHDLLDSLRKIKYEAEIEGEGIDEELLISQAAIFLQGGFDTSATTITYLLYELAYNQEAQEKLYQELIETKQRLGGKDFDGSTLQDLLYFNCVLKETLRKYPPMGWLDRKSDKAYNIDDNLTIPPGTTIYVNAIGMHYDPEFYPDPVEFRPERFLPENFDINRPYLPFGDGPRICIGMRFAQRTIWYAVSEILMNFKIEPLPGEKKPAECEVEKNGLFYAPGQKYLVKFVPR